MLSWFPTLYLFPLSPCITQHINRSCSDKCVLPYPCTHTYIYTHTHTHTHTFWLKHWRIVQNALLKSKASEQKCVLHRTHITAEREGEKIAAGTTNDLYNLFFSPEERWIGFFLPWISCSFWQVCALVWVLLSSIISPGSCSEVVTCLGSMQGSSIHPTDIELFWQLAP